MKIYDLIVLGSGPSGRRAAIQAAKLGKSVFVIDERERLGGVSVHTGTIPSKTLRETVLNLSGWRERCFYGSAYRVKSVINSDDLRSRMKLTLDYEVDVLRDQFQRNCVETICGIAKFLDPHTINIQTSTGESQECCAAHIIIAVGTKPFRPPNVPFDDVSIFDSDSMLTDLRVPRSLTVVGAGVIGIEYATIFSALDVNVTIIEPRKNILEFLDKEIVDEFRNDLRRRGIGFRLGSEVASIDLDAKGNVVAHINDGRRVVSEMLLYTAGRMGATDQLCLEKCGLSVDHRGRLAVNPATFQTEVSHIYATGDVIGFPSLASTSMEQGRIASCHAFGSNQETAPEHFPYGIYAVPEVSSVGQTEEELLAKRVAFECGIARFRETSRGHIMGLQSGMMKLIFALEGRKLLGVHIVGEGATELIHIGQAVINLGGTVEYFVQNVFNYPTLAEAYKIAALDAWNRMCAQS
jgi:NAD(P) transhydrogenase